LKQALERAPVLQTESLGEPARGVNTWEHWLVPNPDEVDAILHVPLVELLDPAVYRQERWGLPGIDRPIHFFEIVGDTIWGATATMLVDLLTRITATAE
jgi:hypothetical protein